MTMQPKRCDPALLNRFFDQELAPGEDALVKEHVMDCATCQRVVRENERLSRIFTASLDQEVSDAHLEEVEERILKPIRRVNTPWMVKLGDLLVSRRFYMPVTAAAAAIVLVVLLIGHPGPEPGPSAIVSSFEGDVASVMILETPESHQTILWISERVILNGGNGENEQT